MAEAFLQRDASDLFDVMSAGLEPGTLNHNVVAVMKDVGLDISGNSTKSVFDLYKQGLMFSYVITVCDREAAERCPIFAGVTTRLHWTFEDPSKFTALPDALIKTTKVRDQIERKVKEFAEAIRSGKKITAEDIFEQQ